MENSQQGAEKAKKTLAELTSMRKIEVAFSFKHPNTKSVLMQTIKQFKDKTPIGVICDLIKDLTLLEDFKSDSSVLAALRPHITKLGSRIQAEGHNLTIDDLSLVKAVLQQAKVDEQEIILVKKAISNKFAFPSEQIRLSNLAPYFQNLEGSPED